MVSIRALGLSNSTQRNQNERLVLALVKSAGEISSGEIARQSGFSAQTASVITRALEAEGFLRRGEPVKGKIGKPSSPVSLNPKGAFSFGLRIGRRRADLILVDFLGRIQGHEREFYAYPVPQKIFDFVEKGISVLGKSLSPADLQRIVGIGVAAPSELWQWLDVVGAPSEEMAAWRSCNFEMDFLRFSDLPVLVGNDVSMACSGELIFSDSAQLGSFLFFYVGSFIGGGLVLNGEVFFGANGNAAAFGSMPVCDTSKPGHQLLNRASLYLLESQLEQKGVTSNMLRQDSAIWQKFSAEVDAWLDAAASAISPAIVAASAVVDVQNAVIGGSFPEEIKLRLTKLITEGIEQIDLRGLRPITVRPSKLGELSGALGAAYQPIQSQYFQLT